MYNSPQVLAMLALLSNGASFVFHDGPGTSMIARLMRENFLTKTKANIRKLRLSRWKTIQIMKTIRFQSSNFTSTLKGYLFQTAKLWKELVERTQTVVLVCISVKWISIIICIISLYSTSNRLKCAYVDRFSTCS